MGNFINSLLRGIIIGVIALVLFYIIAFLAVTDHSIKSTKDIKPLLNDMMNVGDGLKKINVRAAVAYNNFSDKAINTNFDAGYARRTNKIFKDADTPTVVAGTGAAKPVNAPIDQAQMTKDALKVSDEENDKLRSTIQTLQTHISLLESENQTLRTQVEKMTKAAQKKNK